VAVALAHFEAGMCARSEEKVRRSRDAAVMLHSPAAMAEGNNVRALVAAAEATGSMEPLDDGGQRRSCDWRVAAYGVSQYN